MRCESCTRGEADILVVIGDEPFVVCTRCADEAAYEPQR